MNNKEKHKFPRHRKGFSPRAGTGTGDYYRRYSVYQNQRVVSQKQGLASTTVEEDASPVETCTEPECPISSPKKKTSIQKR